MHSSTGTWHGIATADNLDDLYVNDMVQLRLAAICPERLAAADTEEARGVFVMLIQPPWLCKAARHPTY